MAWVEEASFSRATLPEKRWFASINSIVQSGKYYNETNSRATLLKLGERASGLGNDRSLTN